MNKQKLEYHIENMREAIECIFRIEIESIKAKKELINEALKHLFIILGEENDN